MSVENWARRASGLLLPMRSLAAPWRFLPCESCCFSPTSCNDCYDGTLPSTITVDLPALADGIWEGCCDGFENTYILDQDESFPCKYATLIGFGPCLAYHRLQVTFLKWPEDQQCYLIVLLGLLLSPPPDGAPTTCVQWVLGPLDAPVSGGTIPFFSHHCSALQSPGGSSHCTGTGTEVEVY